VHTENTREFKIDALLHLVKTSRNIHIEDCVRCTSLQHQVGSPQWLTVAHGWMLQRPAESVAEHHQLHSLLSIECQMTCCFLATFLGSKLTQEFCRASCLARWCTTLTTFSRQHKHSTPQVAVRLIHSIHKHIQAAAQSAALQCCCTSCDSNAGCLSKFAAQLASGLGTNAGHDCASHASSS